MKQEPNSRDLGISRLQAGEQVNTCRDTQRGGTHRYLVQNGWRYLQTIAGTTREPVMVEITTEWMDRRCGTMDKDKTAECVGCSNNVPHEVC